MQDGRLPGPRRRRPGGSWLVGRHPVARLVGRVVAGLLALACLVAAVVALAPRVVCDGAERAVFAEFSHYGGTDLAPSADFEGGSCAGFFDVQATKHEVLDYYRRELHAHGWAVKEVEVRASGEVEAGTLSAARGGFTYEVLYETGAGLIGGGTHLAIHVDRA
jgi:hypothetical protein